MEPKRSAIPKVVGILMIVFAGLGLCQSVFSLVTTQLANESFARDEMSRYIHVMLVFGLVDLGVGVVHLAAGLRALGYKESAPRLTVFYGVLKIVEVIGLLVIMYAFIGPGLGGARHGESAFIGLIFIMTAVFYLAWPIIAMVLMTRPSAKAACVNL